MTRIAFVLRVDPAQVDEYRAAHRDVWPEMQAALRRTGWHNYSLFLGADGTLFGYFETPGTFAEALAAMDAEPVNGRWQASMSRFFDGQIADRSMVELTEVFHLD